MISQGTRRPEDDEDTIELELTAEEMQGLSLAAKRARDSTAQYAVIESAAAIPASRPTKFRLWPIALAIALVGVATAVVWRPGVSHRGEIRAAPAPVSLPRAAAKPAPAAPAATAEVPAPQVPPAPPVRVKNPFDPKEVFEFPAGTTKAAARKIVSELLLQRAINRGKPDKDDGRADKAPATTN